MWIILFAHINSNVCFDVPTYDLILEEKLEKMKKKQVKKMICSVMLLLMEKIGIHLLKLPISNHQFLCILLYFFHRLLID
jgi:hypothetical protein